MLIEGHTDAKGTSEARLAIADRRAKAAARFLLEEGVPNTRLFTISHGSDRSACLETTESCAARNRRLTLTWRVTLPLARSVFDVKETVAGEMPEAWHRARRFPGKVYYRSLGEAVQALRLRRGT